jgi:hypothetical protein
MTLKADLNEVLERAAKQRRMKSAYLGDSVYVEQDIYGRLWLRRDNGVWPSNSICLKPEVLRRFTQYIAGLNKAGETEMSENPTVK